MGDEGLEQFPNLSAKSRHSPKRAANSYARDANAGNSVRPAPDSDWGDFAAFWPLLSPETKQALLTLARAEAGRRK